MGGEILFENISIWGRIAYGICCLENYIVSLNYPKDGWRIVFNKLWTFDKTEYYDEWFYEITEYLPECILEFENYDSTSKWGYMDEITFYKLYELYSKTREINAINDIMKLIHEICSTELYTTAIPPANSSLSLIKDLLIKVQGLNILIPDVKLFLEFSINQNNCWGIPMSRESISLPYYFE